MENNEEREFNSTASVIDWDAVEELNYIDEENEDYMKLMRDLKVKTRNKKYVKRGEYDD